MFGLTQLPCSIYDIPAMETYLAEQAKRGKRFVGFSGERDAQFEDGEIRSETFRLEPSDGNRRPDPEQEALFLAAGWEYAAASCHDDLWVFRACRADPVPIHTDPETQAVALRRLEKKLRRRLVPWLALLLVLGIVWVWIGWRQIYSLRQLIGNPYPLIQSAYWLFYVLFFGALAVTDLLPLRRLVRSLKVGIPMEHTTRRRGKRHLWRPAFLVMVAVFLGVIFYTRSTQEAETAAREDCVGKYVSMEALGLDSGGRLECSWNRSFLGEEWSVWEGVPERKDTEFGYITSWPASTRLYRLRLPFLAGPLLTELRKDIPELAEAERLTDTALDEAWYARDGEDQRLLARRGNAVLFMGLKGGGEDLRTHLEEFAAVLENG